MMRMKISIYNHPKNPGRRLSVQGAGNKTTLKMRNVFFVKFNYNKSLLNQFRLRGAQGEKLRRPPEHINIGELTLEVQVAASIVECKYME